MWRFLQKLMWFWSITLVNCVISTQISALDNAVAGEVVIASSQENVCLAPPVVPNFSGNQISGGGNGFFVLRASGPENKAISEDSLIIKFSDQKFGRWSFFSLALKWLLVLLLSVLLRFIFACAIFCGSMLAVVISWERNRSILWALVHGASSLCYVFYWYLWLKKSD